MNNTIRITKKGSLHTNYETYSYLTHTQNMKKAWKETFKWDSSEKKWVITSGETPETIKAWLEKFSTKLTSVGYKKMFEVVID